MFGEGRFGPLEAGTQRTWKRGVTRGCGSPAFAKKSERRGLPSLAKEGWPRHQENGAKPPLMERTGWLVHLPINRWLERTAPSAPAKEASRNFLTGAATPPSPRRGIARAYIHSHLRFIRTFIQISHERSSHRH